VTTFDVALARAELARASDQGRQALTEPESKRVLAAFGLGVPRSHVLRDGDAVGPALAELRAPFVVKVVSPDALHKTEMGGVRVNLADQASVEAAAGEMRSRCIAAGARLDGWLVEEMAPKGIEVVIGGMVDDRFGPVVMFGLGGVLVELMADIAFRICPITRRDAHQMISELRGAPLLNGWRGGIVASRVAMVDALMRIGGAGGLMMSLPDVAELDVNPLIVSESGAVAVDARIVMNGALKHVG
jgi:acetate---CoA ligase (ADP-forming) subunit beta